MILHIYHIYSIFTRYSADDCRSRGQVDHTESKKCVCVKCLASHLAPLSQPSDSGAAVAAAAPSHHPPSSRPPSVEAAASAAAADAAASRMESSGLGDRHRDNSWRHSAQSPAEH